MVRLILLVGLGLFLVFGIVYGAFIQQDLQFKEFSTGPITTLAPAGWSMKQGRNRGWERIHFQDGASWLTLAYYADKEVGPDHLERLRSEIRGYALQFPLRVYDDGYYYLFAWGKSKRRFLAIFTHRGVPWWIESGTYRSTHRVYKEVLDRALLHLRIDGEPVSAGLASGIEAIDGEIGIWYVQGERFWLAFMMASGLLTMGLMGLITWLSGRPAKADQFLQETITRQSAGTDVSVRGRGGYKLQSCALYLTDARLVAFGLFRPILDLRHDQDEEVDLSSGDSRFFGMPYLQVIRRKGARITYRFFLHDAETWALEVHDRRRGARRSL
jgi:hypothetical protein